MCSWRSLCGSDGCVKLGDSRARHSTVESDGGPGKLAGQIFFFCDLASLRIIKHQCCNNLQGFCRYTYFLENYRKLLWSLPYFPSDQVASTAVGSIRDLTVTFVSTLSEVFVATATDGHVAIFSWQMSSQRLRHVQNLPGSGAMSAIPISTRNVSLLITAGGKLKR